MRSDWARAMTTLSVWVLITTMALFAMDKISGGVPLSVAMVALLAVAYATTQAIWQNRSSEVQESEKAKRRGKVDLLMRSLDDHELAELRERLMAEADGDGEPMSLDELMARRGKKLRS